MWTTIITIALRLIDMAIGKAAERAEARKAFLEFVERLGALGIVQVRLNAQDQAQVEELRRRRALLDNPPV
jgi:hypothetical protein